MVETAGLHRSEAQSLGRGEVRSPGRSHRFYVNLVPDFFGPDTKRSSSIDLLLSQ